MAIDALPPDALAWVLAESVRVYVSVPPFYFGPPAQVSASLFARASAFFLHRLGIATPTKSEMRELFNAARLFAREHAAERSWCATFDKIPVVEPEFSDEPDAEELEAMEKYGPLEEFPPEEEEADGARCPFVKDGVPCKYKAQEKYAGFCGYHKMAGRAEVERVTADMARTEIGGAV